jgi:hypothetical protein
MFGNVRPAEAARSAGRVGGFAGSSSSAPTRSYGGGGGYSGGGYSGGGGFSRGGYGAGYVAPPPAFYSGGYMAPRIVAPVVVGPYAPAVAVTGSTVASPAMDAIVLMALAFIAFSTVSSTLAGAGGRAGGLASFDEDCGLDGPLQVGFSGRVVWGLVWVAP